MLEKCIGGLLFVGVCASSTASLFAADVIVSPKTQSFNEDGLLEVSTSYWQSDIEAFNGSILARSHRKTDCSIKVKCSSYTRPFYEKSIDVPAGKSVRSDVFIPLSARDSYGSVSLSIPVNGARPLDIGWGAFSRSYHSSSGRDLCRIEKPEYIEGMTWRHFCGLSTMRMKQSIWDALQESSRKSILEWVELGGNLEIEAPAGFRDSILKAYPPMSFSEVDNMSLYGRGVLRVSPKFASEEGFSSSFEAYGGFDPKPDWNVAVLNPYIFIPALVLFGLLIGPGVVMLCKRMKRPALALLLIPLISVVSCAALLILSIVNDGVRPKICRKSVAFLDQQRGKVYVQQILGVEAPMGISTPVNFPEDAIVIIPASASQGRCVASGGRILLESFILPRVPTFFGMAKFESRRERLEVKEFESSVRVTNGLGSSLCALTLRDSKGRIWTISKLEAGQDAELKQSSKPSGQLFAGFHKLELNSSKLATPAPLAPGCYQAWLNSEVFGEKGIPGSRLVGENCHLLIGKY